MFQSDPLGFAVAFAFAAAAFAYGGYGVFKRWSHARFILDTPTSKIRSAAQGYVELKGVLKALPGEAMRAPLTGKECVWWRYRIEEEVQVDKKRQWRVIDSGASEAWLCLDDETGQCLINPNGAQISSTLQQRWQGNTRHPMAVKPSGWRAFVHFGKRYRYSEERLHEAQSLYAIGDFRTQRVQVDSHSLQRDLINQWKCDFPALLAHFDHNQDGELDTQEWEAVRIEAAQQAQQQALKAQAAEAVSILSKPAEKRPFILSDSSESALAWRFYRHAAGHALLCIAGAIGCAWLLGVQSW